MSDNEINTQLARQTRFVVAILAGIAGVFGFQSNFLFATKTEVQQIQQQIISVEAKIEKAEEVNELKRMIIERRLTLINENIKILLRKERLTPLDPKDIK